MRKRQGIDKCKIDKDKILWNLCTGSLHFTHSTTLLKSFLHSQAVLGLRVSPNQAVWTQRLQPCHFSSHLQTHKI